MVTVLSLLLPDVTCVRILDEYDLLSGRHEPFGVLKTELTRPQGGAKGGLRMNYPEGTSAT